jgi:hypothetical protein
VTPQAKDIALLRVGDADRLAAEIERLNQIV